MDTMGKEKRPHQRPQGGDSDVRRGRGRRAPGTGGGGGALDRRCVVRHGCIVAHAYDRTISAVFHLKYRRLAGCLPGGPRAGRGRRSNPRPRNGWERNLRKATIDRAQGADSGPGSVPLTVAVLGTAPHCLTAGSQCSTILPPSTRNMSNQVVVYFFDGS